MIILLYFNRFEYNNKNDAFVYFIYPYVMLIFFNNENKSSSLLSYLIQNCITVFFPIICL